MEEQEQQTTKAKKKRGRPKNENYLSWEEAREFMRAELIPSRGKFFEWYDRNKPKAIPRFPYRVYTAEWISWNDFLGTDNKFNEKVGRTWRPLEEATVWAHSLKLGAYAEWMTFCKEQKDKLPADIPARPDLVYDKWRSWNHWLGNKPAEAVEAKQQAQRSAIYYIIRENDVAENIFSFGVESGGISALRDKWERDKFIVVKMFWYDGTKGNVIRQIVEAFSTPYMSNEKQRITPNVFEMIWHLQVHLDTVTQKELSAYVTKQTPIV